MNTKQIKFILNGRDSNEKIHEEIMCFTLTSTFNAFTERYKEIVPDYDNELLILTDVNGNKEYIDFVDINLVREKPKYSKESNKKLMDQVSNYLSM